MKTLKGSLFVALVVGLVWSTVIVITRSPRTQTTDTNEVAQTNPQVQEADTNEPIVPEPELVATVPLRGPASTVRLTTEKTDLPAADIASRPVSEVRIRADQVLARVNEKVILLKHLVPLPPDEQEQTMTWEEYESRLSRAIEMELTFQAAAAQSVDLTPQQKKRVDGIVQTHQAALQEYKKQGLTWNSVTPEQVEFEQRLASVLMLQQNLVATEAGVAPASDLSVQIRYEQARNEIIRRLKAQGKISVSLENL